MTRATMSENELESQARRYHVRFLVAPRLIEVRSRAVEVVFRLELAGQHEGRGSGAVSSCRACMRVGRTLLDIAGTVLPPELGAVRPIDRGCKKIKRYGRGRHGHSEVSLALEIRICRSFERAVEGWATGDLQSIRRLLLEKGCCERLAEAETGPVCEFQRPASRKTGRLPDLKARIIDKRPEVPR